MKHNWEYKRLGDVGTIVTGSTPSTQDEKYYSSCDVMFVKPGDISENKLSIIDHTETYVSKLAYEKVCRQLPKGTVVVTCIGILGKTGILNKDACCNQQINAIIPSNDILSRYLGYAILSIQEELASKKNGPVVPIINKSKFSNFSIPVPPMEVQERIVAELDKINELIEQNRELLRHLDLLAQSLYIHMFGNWSEFEQLSYYVTQLVGGKSLASQETCANKVLKSGAVTYDYFDGSSTKFLPQNYIPLESHKVKVGDVIISRMNTAELVRACAYVFNVEENIYLPDRLWRLEYKPNANPIFLWKSLISETSKRQIRAKASGTSGSMKNISKPLLLSVHIPKVPLALQEQFATQIEAIETQKAIIEKSISELQTLLDSRMKYWFN